jgi:hypothetical protein
LRDACKVSERRSAAVITALLALTNGLIAYVTADGVMEVVSVIPE